MDASKKKHDADRNPLFSALYLSKVIFLVQGKYFHSGNINFKRKYLNLTGLRRNVIKDTNRKGRLGSICSARRGWRRGSGYTDGAALRDQYLLFDPLACARVHNMLLMHLQIV